MANGDRDRPHVVLNGRALAEGYTPHPPVIVRRRTPPADRRAHGAALKNALAAAADAARLRRGTRTPIPGIKPGIFVTFESRPGLKLALDRIQSTATTKPKEVDVLTVREVGATQQATVFVSEDKVQKFLTTFDEYVTKNTPKGDPSHNELVEALGNIRLATLEGLWTDPTPFPGPNEQIWWEIWLRRTDGNERARFDAFAAASQLTVTRRSLQFPDRVVVMARGTARSLSGSIDVLADLGEVRRVRETAEVVVDLGSLGQGGLLENLVGRVRGPGVNAASVCLLDTGVNAHPALDPVLAPADRLTCEPDWGAADSIGHGTEMAGLAAYGSVLAALQAAGPITLEHRLESVKILRRLGGESQDPILHGAITASGVARIELAQPQRRRVHALAVTSKGPCDFGRPSSWSASVDALAAGRSFIPTDEGLSYLDEARDSERRLFVVSIGNVEEGDWSPDHLTVSDVQRARDPAQAWNALTVGATTQLLQPGPGYEGWAPVAPAGELSPHSRTAVTFDPEWPVKPDVVVEGGNLARSPSDGEVVPTAAMSILTTNYVPAIKPFTDTRGTSPATAQVAHMAGVVSARNPTFWPETVRALVVHSAEWTPRMRRAVTSVGKAQRLQVVRRYGFGVPDLGRALYSATNALTLVAQDTIRPFQKTKMREMHLHELPWPRDVLQGLGETQVRLRVTLSYFVEPNPRSPGWSRRGRYASHGLRFHLRRPLEYIEDFRKRLNKLALEEEDEGERPDEVDKELDWTLGPKTREKGSLHSDEVFIDAATLALCGSIGVVPISGWWKEQPRRDRSDLGARYALVVSIETPRVDVDIWTPVAQMVGITV